MSIGPILPGRIPSSLETSRLVQNLQRSDRLLAQLQDQIATGQRFFVPSEDPTAALRTIILQKSIERNGHLQTNVRTDLSFLNATESTLATVGDSLNRAKAILLEGVGDATTTEEKLALAAEVASQIQSVISAGNTKLNGRYLFGGSLSQNAPFEMKPDGTVRFGGDSQAVNSFVDFDFLLANNVDGVTAFAALTPPVGNDVNPALTLGTRISDLYAGRGVALGPIVISLSDGVNPVETETVDLSSAKTIADVKTLIENKFSGLPVTLTVEVDPGWLNGLRLTPSAGTVAVTDRPGSRVAVELGIAGGPAAQINGGDLDPRLTFQTRLADLNNGAGIAQTPGQGLLITNGALSKTIDVSSADTVEDLFNLIKAADPDVELDINADGNGLAVRSRLSGADFSIGENGGTAAAELGIRTLDGGTLLSELNLGRGVPVNNLDQNGNLLPVLLEITRRDGSATSIDLKGLKTIQQVIGAINAVDANLSAQLNVVGNGISITDASGTGPLVVAENPVSSALGLAGEETGSDNTIPLIGSDVHPRRANGTIGLLVQLEAALRNGDDAELARLDPLVDAEISRFNRVRADVGSRLRVLDSVQNRLLDSEVVLKESLSSEFDTDLSRAVAEFASISAALQATLQIAAQSLQLSLLNYL